MSEAAVRVSVVIPTHNRSDALALTLEHLAKQDFRESWEAVVVNNNCTDDTDIVVGEWRKKFPVPLHYLHEQTPGPAAARNTGAAAATGVYLVFIDNDILTESDFVTRHYENLSGRPGCWIAGQVVNLPEQDETAFGKYRRSLAPGIPRDSEVIEIDGNGTGFSMPRADFERLGGFDENFFVASGEDRELGMRAIKSGIKILLDPAIVAVHNDWAGSTIGEYCRRQRIYTQTEPLFASMYGEENPRYEMQLKNSSPALGRDGLKLYVWKKVKGVLGSALGQASMIRLCELAEKTAPDSRVLWSLYRLAIAGAIYKGYQEGVAILSAARSDSKELKNETAVG